MDAAAIRALQAPVKQRYRDNPTTALTPARAEARIDPVAVHCLVDTWAGETTAGLHPATGGDGAQACSADMLLEALTACAGVTLSAVASAMELPIRGGRIIAQGWWDARGTLGLDKAAPVGLTEVTLHFELDTDASADAIARLIQLTERFCVIYQTLAHSPVLRTEHRIVSDETSG